MDSRHEEPRNLAEELDLPEQLNDDETAAPAGGPLRFARMTGSSIAGRDAAAWVTDFLNAAYYRRPVAERQVDDLRLAFSVLTTYWYRKGRGRLRVTDLPAFHRAFGAHRFDTQDTGRGLLSRDQLLEGAAGLIGDWFPDAYHDDERRGWGIAFPTAEEKAAYDPRAPAQARAARRADPGERPARAAGLAHLPAGADAVRRSGHRRADQARDLAGLRVRARPLHAAARARPGWPDVRDRGRGRHRVRPADLHPRLRDHHQARHPRRPGRAGRLVRRAGGRPGPLRRQRAARGPGGRHPAGRVRPDHPPGALHGQRPQPAAALRPRRPGVGAGRRHVGPDALARRQGLRGRRPRRAARVLGPGRSGDDSPERVERLRCCTSSRCGSPDRERARGGHRLRARTGWPPRSRSPGPAAR